MDYKIDHVAIVVRNLEKAARAYIDGLGLTLGGIEVVEEQGARVGFFKVRGPRIELVEPFAPDTALGKFLEKKGPGLHHIALKVPDIDLAIKRMKDAGLRLIDERAKVGAGGKRVAFVHPRSFDGVLVELVQE